MASQHEEQVSGSITEEQSKTPSSKVQFGLEESQRTDHSNASFDEVDEFMELSSLSNPPSTSSFDSISNGTITNGRAPTVNGTMHDHKKTLKNYSRYVCRFNLSWKRRSGDDE